MSRGPTGITISAAGPRPTTRARAPGEPLRIALLGMPNTGKTTLFNRLTGLRHKTSNFPGTTVEARLGFFTIEDPVELIDLPGVYSIELDQIESQVVREVLAGRKAFRGEPLREPDGVCVVLDATNLARNLTIAGEALRRRLPTVIAVNMIDLAEKQGLKINIQELSERLGCPVVTICARAGEGLDALRAALGQTVAAGLVPTRTPPSPGAHATHEQDEQALRRWADELFPICCAMGPNDPARAKRRMASEALTDQLDRVLTHPISGLAIFAVLMSGLFYALFSLAQFPMEWIDWIFASVGGGVRAILPAGLLADFLADGVVAGVGATIIFLPQICLLFFIISVLEDTGYLSRAALMMDRALRPFGLPGHAFVPLLSSHACALPGIMATRCIPDVKQRLATILVAPFMTCSARLPVFVLLTGLLFPTNPALAALAFIGCYALGIGAGMFSALIARRTILRGPARAMALELPSYKRPSLRTAFITTYDRGMTFVKKAGTNILAVSVILWWLGSFPHVEPPKAAVDLRERAAQVAVQPTANTDQQTAAQNSQAMLDEADRLERQHAKAETFIGHMGRFVEPVLAPIGADWQLSIGVLASFAAREVFVSTMTVVVAGEESDDVSENPTIRERLTSATRDDGTKLFTPAASWSLLVFFVLAMQCLPTLVVTAREAGGAKWAFLQLAWMSGLAFGASTIVYQVLRSLGYAGVPIVPGGLP